METAVVKYDKDMALIKALDKKYEGIIIRPGNKDDMAIVMAGLKEYKNHRLEVVEWHKAGKAEALKVGKKYDAEKNKWLELIAPGENTLKATRKEEDDRIAEIEITRIISIKRKINDVKILGWDLQGLDLLALQDRKKIIKTATFEKEEYQELLGDVMAEVHNTGVALNIAIEARIKSDQEEAERKAENERLEKIRKEQAVAQAGIKEAQDKIDATNKKLKEKQEKKEKLEEEVNYQKGWFIDNIRMPGIEMPSLSNIDRSIITLQNLIDNKNYNQTNPPLFSLLNEQLKEADEILKFRKEQVKLQTQKDTLEAEKRAEEQRKREEEFKKQAKERAEREAKEKLEREAIENTKRAEVAEAENKRQLALTPDREKLLGFADELDIISLPKNFKDDRCNIIVSDAMKEIQAISTRIRKAAEKL